ncbi:MAG: ABC transporter ATP-binding protein [Polyangiaceae bacterium]|nr:ABC transporter ATP-binding protein [Polyangiaceae bacterium]
MSDVATTTTDSAGGTAVERTAIDRSVIDRTGEALVLVEGLTKSFQHMGETLEVLRGIDLNIYGGEVLSIVGASGAGKSTLMHCLGTLDLPTTGKIRLAGEDLTSMGNARLAKVRNRHIGFVFQFHHLLPEFTAVENVMMPGLIQGRPKAEMEKRAKALLDEVGMSHRGSHRPGELSGGEQQRVAIARSVVLGPKLLLADEPTGNLDTATSEAIHQLFFDINREHGTTIVVVTHNIAFAKSMPRVVTMRDGRVIQDDRSDNDAFRAPANAEATD